MKIIEVTQVQPGDNLVINNVLHKVDYVEPNGLALDMQLHNPHGEKVHRSFIADAIVSVDI